MIDGLWAGMARAWSRRDGPGRNAALGAISPGQNSHWRVCYVSTPAELERAVKTPGLLVVMQPGVYDCGGHRFRGSSRVAIYGGHRAALLHGGLVFDEARDVAIVGVGFEEGPKDGISWRSRSAGLFVDSCWFRENGDGGFDATIGGTDWTLSNCTFKREDKALLVGASKDHGKTDKNIRGLITDSHFDQCGRRCPSVRHAELVHVRRTLISEWDGTAIEARRGARLLLEHVWLEPGPHSGEALSVNHDAAVKLIHCPWPSSHSHPSVRPDLVPRPVYRSLP